MSSIPVLKNPPEHGGTHTKHIYHTRNTRIREPENQRTTRTIYLLFKIKTGCHGVAQFSLIGSTGRTLKGARINLFRVFTDKRENHKATKDNYENVCQTSPSLLHAYVPPGP